MSAATQLSATDSAYLRHDEAALLDVAARAVAAAAQRGLGAVARVNESAGLTVTARDGAVETRIGDQSQRLTLTVHDGQRQGHAGTGRFDAESIDAVVDRAAALARFGGEDPDRGLAPSDLLVQHSPVVPLLASSGWTTAELAHHAIAIEHAAIDRGIASKVPLVVDGAGAQSHDHRFAMATSNGFAGVYSASTNARWCSVAAGKEGDRRMSSWSSVQRDPGRLQNAVAISGEAVARAVASLAPRAVAPQKVPVLFENRLAGELVGALLGALGGNAQVDAATFLPNAIGATVAASHLTLREDPFVAFGAASAPFDGEGIAGSARDLVTDGVAQGYLLDLRASRRLGMAPTGNANGAYNVRFVSRLTNPADDLAAMLRRLDTGLFVTSVSGKGFNAVTGDYSRAVTGFWVHRGEIVHPVEGITIAGNLKTVLAGIVAIGADLPHDGQIRSGSILVDRLDIAAR